MDALVSVAARALREGDPLGALQRVALREDAPALALRGIAMAQLGELTQAAALLKRAARAYGPGDALARARCGVARAEVALAARELEGIDLALDEALLVFTHHGDTENARYTRLLRARHALLLGRIEEAERTLSALEREGLPAMPSTLAWLLTFEVAVRRGTPRVARPALEQARTSARRARIPALFAEVEQAARALDLPAARVLSRGEAQPVVLDEVEALLESEHLVVDACRRVLRAGPRVVTLSTRPILFSLLRVLAEAWPKDSSREELVRQVFGARRMNASHRARLRVEMGRLRAQVHEVAGIQATPQGFVLEPRRAVEVRVLAPPVEGAGGAVLALLADGEHWSTSALALALGASQRTVQRALTTLEATGQARVLGRGRARRWVAPPLSGFTTTLLLPASPLPG
ncbi:helix-turn-helix domain-containing protein [Myxococcus sp. K38C18041901]|uniref:helix-turn-helix domain-containing protein n=1 Tax=Myxococcus guangdongensis TaxID=2906760 RepID=UPI0020A82AC7|nr:helix-turn-helix domain-containing protein [Myxococcus guangdongensis]MCP3057375.1 helix-turn-helix domain-containing protein [Myxococcus guangdongensis]